LGGINDHNIASLITNNTLIFFIAMNGHVRQTFTSTVTNQLVSCVIYNIFLVMRLLVYTKYASLISSRAIHIERNLDSQIYMDSWKNSWKSAFFFPFFSIIYAHIGMLGLCITKADDSFEDKIYSSNVAYVGGMDKYIIIL